MEVGIQSTTATLGTRVECFEPHSGLLRTWASRAWFPLRKASDRAFWSILAEEFLISQRGVVELVVIVLGPVEELTVCRVHLVIVLGEFDIEVGNPAELSIDITLL